MVPSEQTGLRSRYLFAKRGKKRSGIVFTSRLSRRSVGAVGRLGSAVGTTRPNGRSAQLGSAVGRRGRSASVSSAYVDMRLATCVFSFDRGLTKMIIVFHETRPETRHNSPGPLLTTDPGVALLKASFVLVRVFTPPLGENRFYDFESRFSLRF